MEIVKFGHPVLKWKSKPFQDIPDGFDRIIDEMFELMYSARGVGLAANQVGLPYRFFIANPTADPAEKDEEFVFINPKIVRKKGWGEAEEGCLSLPEVFGDVERAQTVEMEAFDLDGEAYSIEADDLMARILQHELDHLDGVLFIDRMKPDKLDLLRLKIRNIENQFRQEQKDGKYPSDDVLRSQLADMERTFALPLSGSSPSEE